MDDGTIEVVHYAWSDGCCPQIDIAAEGDGDTITVRFELYDDFCNCICSLNVGYTLTGVPAGTWTLEVAGGPTIEGIEVP